MFTVMMIWNISVLLLLRAQAINLNEIFDACQSEIKLKKSDESDD